MDFIKQNSDLLDILQIFIDLGCIIYGDSVNKILFKNNIKNIKLYIPNKNVEEDINQLIRSISWQPRYYPYRKI